jgi:hypothetical protein
MRRYERGIQSLNAIEPGDAHVNAPKRPTPTTRRRSLDRCKHAGRTPECAIVENMHQMQYAALIPKRRPRDALFGSQFAFERCLSQAESSPPSTGEAVNDSRMPNNDWYRYDGTDWLTCRSIGGSSSGEHDD